MRIWGARGSVPSPGPHTAHYGGNTPCVEVETAEGRRVILDAGTGLYWLGKHLLASGFAQGRGEAHLLLSHTHWAHIQGLPFCTPLLVPGNRFTLRGSADGRVSLADLLEAQMHQTYCPVPDFFTEGIGAAVEVLPLAEGGFAIGRTQVRARRLNHAPGAMCLGYRLEEDGVSLAYLPDVEYLEEEHRRPALELARAADLLLHDAHYTLAEYPRHRGQGHASDRDAFALARQAGVGRLLLFHHHPDRRDGDLDAVVQGYAGQPLLVEAAREGSEYILGKER